MKDKILSFVISQVVQSLLGNLSSQQIKAELDRLIDRFEDLIADSSNTLDDQLMPVIKFVRDAFDVPDFPD